MEYVIVGVDCAAQPSDVGLARLRGRAGSWLLEEVALAEAKYLPEQIVADWIHGDNSQILLAMDAPLGWPVPMQDTLRNHTAGSAIDVDANDMFRRTTDRFIA